MKLRDALQKLLDGIEGHEKRIATEISKRTSVSEAQVEKGIELAREELGATGGEQSDSDGAN
ncbi:hypothetical protein [Halarchaeum sp. P4]|uniref:hypothetical protein n=1 Tax=Halarchaeum sp. P4 TaxID=3421639 RepID=UPI003EBD7598